MNYAINHPRDYQSEPERIKNAVGYLIQKSTDAKRTIEELLYLLDMQEKVPWPDMLEKFSSLAAAMSQVQGALRKSALPSGHEDHGQLLRSHVMVPLQLTLDPNPELQRLTENRVHSWNHDVVPDYLRTKPSPDIESEELALEQERQSKQQDLIQRQIGCLNKHVDTLLAQLQNTDRVTGEMTEEKPTYVEGETARLVRAVLCGEALRVTMQRSAPPPGVPGAPGAPGGAPGAPGGGPGGPPQMQQPGPGMPQQQQQQMQGGPQQQQMQQQQMRR